MTLCKWIGPPSETNFGGAYLTGELHDVNIAAEAFVDAVAEVVASPTRAIVRPERERF